MAAGDAQQDAKAPPVNRFPVTFVQQDLWCEVPDARQRATSARQKKRRVNRSLGRAAERVRYCSRSHALFGQSEVGQADVACGGVSAVGKQMKVGAVGK